jgi:Glycosyl transferase family 11
MEIVVRQISGLGNQLFQYAAGRYYAKKYGASLRIATMPEGRSHSYGHPRPYLLTKFEVASPSHEITAVERLLLSKNLLLGAASSIMRKAMGVQIVQEPWEERYTYHPELPICEGVRTVYLLGYWQVYSLADAIAPELRAELSLVDPPRGPNHDMMSRIHRAAVPVSLHIRRGDYLHPSEGNIALPLGYYLSCIRTMQKRFAGPTFFVFSDDIAYAREHLPRDIDLVFVDHNNSFSAHEDLRLMSQCHHHIIANSTMSWWGAWLNPSSQKIVVAPRHWRVGGSTESPDLLPPGWLLVDDTGE